MHRYTRLAASITLLAMIVAVLFPPQSSQYAAMAGQIVMLPDGGRLDAFDEKGNAIGPCPLKHTDVDVQISGHFSRVTVNQVYQNPYDRKIEALYTFPLSHRGAVDRMTMTIGERVVEGEVKEREAARQIYEAARDQGYVAALLEQERPNIFTQSVANIEPGATIEITISYVEILESVDGEYQFSFPMVVAPRYIPGQPTGAISSGEAGGNFSPDTDQVPDASKITPKPVKPEKRAGHDISVTVTLDTGGPGLLAINSSQHEISKHVLAESEAGKPRRVSIALAAEREIPNRDFLLSWKQTGETINEAIFTHTSGLEKHGDFAGGFFTMVLQLPDRVADEDVRPREIIFVLDNSGSMRGAQLGGGHSALSAAKKVINQAIDTMRPNDRFNVISFNNTLDVLWNAPQPNTEENRARAQRYVDQRQGGGGTEMRNAVLKALERRERENDVRGWLSPRDVLDKPADGRKVRVAFSMDDLRGAPNGIDRHYVKVNDDLKLHLRIDRQLMRGFLPKLATMRVRGEWRTVDGQRVLHVTHAEQVPRDDDGFEEVDPMRIVLFVTDGLVGNDEAIIRAIRENSDSTRVFPIGMSRSPNRYLLDEMARAGRGAVDYVLPDDDVEPIVERFAQRIATPVLTDISLEFSNELEVMDVLPGLDRLPDLFDVQPLVIHGRYDPAQAASGTLTIRGRTGAGGFERVIDLDLPAEQFDHDVIATLWARSMVDERRRERDREGIIALGEAFQIMSEHTSFVAVEKARITVGGKPMLVRVPIEFPKDMSWEGIFGSRDLPPQEVRTDDELAGVVSQLREIHAQVRSAGRASARRPHDVDADGVVYESAPQFDANRALQAAPARPAPRDTRSAGTPYGSRDRIVREPSILPPDAVPSIEPSGGRAPSAPGGGGFSGGGGGTLFGMPGADPSSARSADLTEEERLEQVRDLIMEFTVTDAWHDYGGTQLDLEHRNGHWHVAVLSDTDEARAAAEQARAFIGQYEPIFTHGGKVDPKQHGIAIGHQDDGAGDAGGERNVVRVYDLSTAIKLASQRARGAFAGESDAVDRAIDLILELVDSRSWTMLGGIRGHISTIDHWLFISNTQAVQRQIQKLFDGIEHAAEPDVKVVNVESDRELLIGGGRLVIHDVRDLVEAIQQQVNVSHDEAADALVERIITKVDSSHWTMFGGAGGEIREFASLLLIITNDERQEQIDELLTTLRNEGVKDVLNKRDSP